MKEMKDLFSLNEKVIIVTGGMGYLGRVMVKSLIEFGGIVVISDISESSVESILESTEGMERLHVVKCDLTKTDSIKQMFSNVDRLYGKIDVLVNCAAYGGGSGGKGMGGELDDITDSIWECGIDGTLGVTFRCTREVLPYFYKNQCGNIINIASMYGMVAPDPGIYGTSGQNSPPAYGTGKAGVLQFTRYCAAKLAKKNIRVNSITPGPFPNPKSNLSEEFLNRLNSKNMLGRKGKPEELAGALVLLASNASSYMTGSNIVVDGGWTAW